MGVLVVARLFVHRHQPPQRCASGEPDGGAVELVQQQVVLGGAAVFRTQLCVALATDEAGRVDQEEVGFGALAGRPGFEQQAFLAQFGQLALAQIAGMADPEVHVALIGLGQGTQAAHQEQPVDRTWQAGRANLVGKRASQALGFGQGRIVRFVVRQAGRCAARDVAGQQRMIDVEKQRQHVQYHLLARRQAFQRPREAALIELQEARAQLVEHLAVDALVQVRAYFVGARHRLAALNSRKYLKNGSLQAKRAPL